MTYTPKQFAVGLIDHHGEPEALAIALAMVAELAPKAAVYDVGCMKLDDDNQPAPYVEQVHVLRLDRHRFQACSPRWGLSGVFPSSLGAVQGLAYKSLASVRTVTSVRPGA